MPKDFEEATNLCYNTQNMPFKINQSWEEALKEEFTKPYFIKLFEDVKNAYRTDTVFPPLELIFSTFEHCPFDDVRVVILGQDPYHGDHQAHGLAFSVQDGIRVPPSLKNIYKEIKDDIGTDIPFSGNLEHWADQGVLLLNATLTVKKGSPGSHQGLGWKTFTDAVIQKISDEKENVVFLLWGKYAEAKGKNIDTTKHLVLTAAHPSPFSAHSGFFGCKHFSKTNSYLKKQYIKKIEW